jgi:hypothetical protein
MNALIREKKGDGIASVSGAMNASSGLLARLLESAGSGHAYHEPSLNELTIKTLGGVIDYDFMKADLILSFGARIFEGWGNPVAMNRFIAERKPGQKIIRSRKLFAYGLHGRRCDHVRAGTEAALAMGQAAYMSGKNSGALGRFRGSTVGR